VPGLPVDRHVLRVANRIGIARSEDPEVVEQQLCAAIPPEEWTRTSDTLILHGRRICKPRPLCEQCVVRDDCDYYQALVRAAKKVARANSPAMGASTAAAPKRAKTGSLTPVPRAAKPQGTRRGIVAPRRTK
jgi:endonuclease-3